MLSFLTLQRLFIYMMFTCLAIAGCQVVAQSDKIPVSTSSGKALDYFLEGRDIFDKLQAQESLTYFEKAVAEDDQFALGFLFLAQAQPNPKGFFEYLKKAVSLAGEASEGERLWILGVQAAANGSPLQQREYFLKLAALYPNDERTHTLLGNNYFGQQEYNHAISCFNKAIQINPNYTQPYNQLGYAYRFLEDYDNAAKTFQKYIELMPGDVNPQDSYAELLMKMSQYEKSIDHYKKALSINPNFVASHIGIACNLNFLGQHAAARKQLQLLLDLARNDGEKRAAMFSIAVSYVDEGDFENALSEFDKQYAIAEKINDAAGMSADLQQKGNILLEAGKYDKAQAMFEKALKTVQSSGLSAEVKENASRIYFFNSARVALRKNDLQNALLHANAFHEAIKSAGNPFQMKLYHELKGQLDFSNRKFDEAIAELKQSNLQNPQNLLRLALVFKEKGDTKKCREYCDKAITFNALNSFNQGFARITAPKILSKL